MEVTVLSSSWRCWAVSWGRTSSWGPILRMLFCLRVQCWAKINLGDVDFGRAGMLLVGSIPGVILGSLGARSLSVRHIQGVGLAWFDRCPETLHTMIDCGGSLC